MLGSLCAIDTAARRWTAAELTNLGRIARACSTELRLRLSGFDAGREEERRDHVEAVRGRSYSRSETLLRASQAFADTSDVDDVLARIRDLVHSALRPDYVGAVVLDDQRGTIRLEDDPVALAPTHTPELDAHLPSARAIREAAIIHYPNREAFADAHPPAAAAIMQHLGMHSVVAVPLPGSVGPVGSIVLGWKIPNIVDAEDLLTIATIGGYASQALTRARNLQHRITVAHEMQNALLTPLPLVEGLQMAARYAPADARENVGGDWYDAAPVPHPTLPDRQTLVVSVGDIIGHNIDAATVMGQVRSMLRQTAWDHAAERPSAILRAFESANRGLRQGAAGTVVIARFTEQAPGSWTMSWTNAGHPPPVLVHPDGTAELLSDHDALFASPSRRPFRATTTTATSHRAAPCSSTPMDWSNTAGRTSTTALRHSCSSWAASTAARFTSWCTRPSTSSPGMHPTTSSPSPSGSRKADLGFPSDFCPHW